MVVADNEAKEIYNYVCEKLKMNLAESVTMGVLDDKGELLAGVVYYKDEYGICHISVYAEKPTWALPKRLCDVLRVGFEFLKCKILKFEVSHKNLRAVKLLKGLGVVREGLLRFNRADGTHEVVFSLTEKEFKKKRWYRK